MEIPPGATAGIENPPPLVESATLNLVEEVDVDIAEL